MARLLDHQLSSSRYPFAPRDIWYLFVPGQEYHKIKVKLSGRNLRDLVRKILLIVSAQWILVELTNSQAQWTSYSKAKTSSSVPSWGRLCSWLGGWFLLYAKKASLVTQMVKHLPAMWETQVQSLGWDDPLEKGMSTHCSILAWESPWTEETSGL